MRRFALLTTAAACLAAPAAAPAATTYVIKGAGFGHGIGMSQYGAQGFAQQGWDYKRILGHYYTGTEISQAPTKSIRVLLRSGGSQTVSHVGQVGSSGRKLNPARSYTASASGAGVVLRDARTGRRVARSSGVLRLRGSGGYFRLGGNYRGSVELRAGSGGVIAVNVVGLDKYVQGVIPGEMPTSWLPEALKVQAVAARSYALTTDAGGAIFDQYADTRSQMYRGMSSEQPSTNAAAKATAGEVVTYAGQIATTYYFSTSGGRTENIENVWSGAQPSPYLKSVEDPYDGISPRHRWQLRFSGGQLKARLGSLCAGGFRGIKAVKRGESPRVKTARVRCSAGSATTTGTTLRARLGLYDTWFTVVRASSKAKRAKSDVLGLPGIGDLVHPRTISGSFQPRPKQVDVERRGPGGRWELVAHGLTNRLGQYAVPVYRAGTYRVRADGVAADPITVR